MLPPPLAPGARVALVAPAGPLRNEDDLTSAMENVRALGWEPLAGAHVMARNDYLAGTDDERAGDLNRAITDRSVDAIWCVRGGYGCARILSALDYDALRARPKTIIGYSDITALHAAVRARTGLVTFHGPTARAPLTPFTRGSLERAVTQRGEPCGAAPLARVLRSGCARGALVGGNLAIVTSLIGTAYAVDCDGAILFLEDVNEPAYRIDRMLLQLELAGLFARCRGLVLGRFTERGDSVDDERVLDELLQRASDAVDGPCIASAPLGHIDDQWTVPVGAAGTLDADTSVARLDVDESAEGGR